MKTVNDNKKQLANIYDDYEDKLLILKERKNFKDIYNKGLDKLNELTKENNYDDLKFRFEGISIEINFSGKKRSS